MLNNDRQITISNAKSRKDTHVQPQTIFVSEFYEKLSIPTRGAETLAEYMKLPKSKQDELKDVGGFIGGTSKDNGRKANSVTARDIITLDLDNIPSGETKDILLRVDSLGCSYVIYSTRKHEEYKPRLRVLVPTNRTVATDEYEPIARKVASLIGIELCDPTTFEVSRLMYNPSCCRDSNYIYTFRDKPFLDADGILSTYTDWHNMQEWPRVPGEQDKQAKLAAKQANPTEKPGIVGAFCRTYDIYRAMEEFLPDVYEPCDNSSNRFTYAEGSTTGGAVIYEDGNFLYSHHATDPGEGKLCNSFDLVRLHKFSDADNDSLPGTPVNKLPSYKAMCEFALKDKSVSILLDKERYEKATQDFGTAPSEDDNWTLKLEKNSNTGLPAKTIDNILIILANDPLLKSKIAFNEFANRAEVLCELPWDRHSYRRTWSDVDDAGLIHYLEHVYSIKGERSINYAFTLYAYQNSFNEIKNYLTSLKWDSVKRLDTLFIDYLGAADTEYTREVTRKSLVAAVARAMMPGCKYDTMTILGGPQGIGKSTLLSTMAKDWFSDSLQTFEGKEASEMIQGVWINEIGELNAMSKAVINAVKQFLSRTDDIFREPFGKRTGRYPRRCVFFGTTNDAEYLKDLTGNRRFWPVDVWVQPITKNVWEQLPDEVDQIWAEAFLYWQVGEKLYLTGETAKEALMQQEKHSETDPKEGIIREFVARQVLLDWDKRNLNSRKMYWSDDFKNSQCETIERDRICAAEIWCECLNGDLKYMKQRDTREINNILSKIPGWKKCSSTYRFGSYGIQRGFIKN